MVMIGEDLAAKVEQMHLQSILQITTDTVEPVMKSKIRSRRSSMPQNTVERR